MTKSGANFTFAPLLYNRSASPGLPAASGRHLGGYRELAAAELPWRHGTAYRLAVEAVGNRFRVCADNALLIEYADDDRPYLSLFNADDSRTRYRRFAVRGFRPMRKNYD